MKTRNLLATLGPLLLASCATGGEHGHDHEELGAIEQRLFTNGDFEDGAAGSVPPGWTLTTYSNPGVTFPPTSRDSLNLGTGGVASTSTLNSATGPEMQVDASLGSGASLRWPKYGNKVAVVNQTGSSTSTNSLRQTMTVSSSDVDPLDGKAHVRFTVAPVLENPGHSASQQPYYFVQLRNVTKNVVLYRDFNASAQPGVPWKTANGVYYTDWQLVDIAPGDAQMAVGDQVELEVIAARCSLGGHFGRVYVDGVGATIPGLFVSGTGPNAANAGDNVTYRLAYSNGGTGAAGGVVVEFNIPPNTTWVGLNAPGLTCSQPAVGASSGAASCTIGTLAPGAGGTFDVTVRINNGATGTITAGHYQISGTSINPLLGPKVFTAVTTGVTYADLAISKTNGVAGVAWGQQNVTYQIVATNNGPSAVTNATVTDTLPAQLENAQWACVAAGGGSCGAASGNGNFTTTVNLPVGATATFTLQASVVAGSGSGTLSNTASISVPGGVTDTNTTNNAGVDTDMIGELQTVTINKSGNGVGTIVSAPSAINCGTGCTSASGTFVNGTTVTFNAVPGPGETFGGWGGACSGTATSCDVLITGDLSITATFTSPPKANGQSCATGDQCASGNCADNVCCDTACGGSVSDCQSCAVVGSEGTCTLLGNDVQCSAASCTSGVITQAASCNGTSPTCPTAGTTSCQGHVCDGATCKATCAGNVDCTSGHYCDLGSGDCQPLVTQGGSCNADVQCVSGHCVDGVCCDMACDGQCEACNLTGSEGTCSARTGDPVGARPACAGAGATCGGTCDGQLRTACAYPGTSTTCGPPSCAAGVATLAALCDGAGACSPAATQSCGDYVCGATACLGDCTVDAHCAGGRYCSAGICVAQLEPAATCDRDAMCASGNCVDGVCCDTSCDGQCEACDVSGSEGVCSPVVGVPHGGRPACAGGSSVCAGVCDGQVTSACTYPGTETECRAAECSDGVATLGATCDEAGSCPGLQTVSCGQYACGAAACQGDCTADVHCADGNFCAAGVCTAKLLAGQVCGGDNQCATGHCVDGVCCDTACTGQCEACDVAGSVGACSAVTGAPHGARDACAADGSVCDGTCDGTERAVCTYPGAEVDCRSAACSDGVATLAATCNGQGACPDVQQQDCGGFLCGLTACRGDCVRDGDCALGSYCSAGVCVAERDNGATCSADNQCASGHCVDGVCCNTACEGQCAACDLDGAKGTCSPVSGAPRGGRAACLGWNTCKGVCDGVDMDACVYPGAETTCGESSCTDGIETSAGTCREGTCTAGVSSSCGDYACGGDRCRENCQVDGDCADGRTCVIGACVVPNAPPEQELPPSRSGELAGGGFGCSTARTTGAPAGGASQLLLAGGLALALAGSRRRRKAAA
jgi:uncharacterized repeat protein (TIGR01451 family)